MRGCSACVMRHMMCDAQPQEEDGVPTMSVAEQRDSSFDWEKSHVSETEMLAAGSSVAHSGTAAAAAGAAGEVSSHVLSDEQVKRPSVMDPVNVAATTSGRCSREILEVQRNVERLVASGQNVFFTGNAGTGKSFLLNR